MTDKFTILEKKTGQHGLFSKTPSAAYQATHPNVYLVRHSSGTEMKLLSGVGDYKPGSVVDIEYSLLSPSSSFLVDHSPSKMAMAAPAPVPPGITIDKEIMVVLTDVRLKGNFREAAGTIFYLPDEALKGQPDPVKAAIKEGSQITVTTDAAYDDLQNHITFLNRAYAFAKLRNVRLPGELAGSTTITADHTSPRSPGFLSQNDLDKALRP